MIDGCSCLLTQELLNTYSPAVKENSSAAILYYTLNRKTPETQSGVFIYALTKYYLYFFKNSSDIFFSSNITGLFEISTG